jgi:hypothetical protein
MSTIPASFVKMQTILTFSPQDADWFVGQVLKMIVRDYHFRFAANEIHDGKYFEFHFWCQPGNEEAIARQMGLCQQAVQQTHNPYGIFTAAHTLPDGFPECLRVEHEPETIEQILNRK